MFLRERQACSACGTRDEEWDPSQGGHRRAYIAEARICRGCQAIEARDSALTDDERGGGVKVVLRKRRSDSAES